MRDDIKVWWKQAEDDLDSAKANFEIKQYRVASLLAQQALEKALKALYIKRFNELKKTHDLVFLANKLDLPEDLRGVCKELDPLYLQTRYPDATGNLPSELFDKADTFNFISLADEVMEWIEKAI